MIEEKRILLESAAASGHWICYEHDPDVAVSRVEWTGKKFQSTQEQASL